MTKKNWDTWDFLHEKVLQDKRLKYAIQWWIKGIEYDGYSQEKRFMTKEKMIEFLDKLKKQVAEEKGEEGYLGYRLLRIERKKRRL